MKKLYLNTGGFDTIFNELKDTFNGELTSTANEYKLTFKSKWAKGSISGSSFDKEMTYMHFDLTFYDDAILSIESNPSAPVFFAYCTKGRFTHSFGANGESKYIKENHSSIVSNTSAINSVLSFESHKQIQFSIIGVPTFVNAKENNLDLVAQLRKKFIHESGNFIHQGVQTLKVKEKFQELNSIPQKGTVRYLLMKSILNDIVEFEIAQHSYNYLNTFDPIVNLAARQFSEIKRISTKNFSEVLHAAGSASLHLIPRIFKEKYHISYKPFNQKLAS